MTPEEEERRLAVQRRNARVMAVLLGAFVILMFAVSIAKIGLRHP
jgi:cytochrome c oxidase assembly protein Cox11